MTVPVAPLGVASGIVIGAAGGILVQRYRYQLERKQSAKDWFADALGLIARVEHLGRRVTEFQPETNTEKLRSELDPLSEEIKEHAAGAPGGVPREARERMDDLGDIANGLVIIVEQGDEESPTELLNILQKSAKERGETNPSIEQVNQLIEGVDIEAIQEELPNEEVEFKEEQVDAVLGQLSDETRETGEIQSVEDALDFDFDAVNEAAEGHDVVDEAMDDTMREYVRAFMLDVTGAIYDEMEARRDHV
ncbi:hypothetical protein [Halorubellus sp. PRR65]|uniref:hypothetical protein n=1 Tax=Halorubellus sp. PRR65 TaxID=3098148 RepID=UPI002B259D3A|nr:hypothetical protein [Halorubellus sp. PRR65]